MPRRSSVMSRRGHYPGGHTIISRGRFVSYDPAEAPSPRGFQLARQPKKHKTRLERALERLRQKRERLVNLSMRMRRMRMVHIRLAWRLHRKIQRRQGKWRESRAIERGPHSMLDD